MPSAIGGSGSVGRPTVSSLPAVTDKLVPCHAHRQRRTKATETTSRAAAAAPSPTRTYFKATPYAPPRSRNLSLAMLKDVSPDKFFVELHHPYLPTDRRLDETVYNERKKLAAGSLIKLKTQSFDGEHSDREIGEMLENEEASSMGMSAGIATSGFATAVKRRHVAGRDAWRVRNRGNGEEGLRDGSNLVTGSRRCILSFPSVSVVDFVDNVRFMWPESVGRESVEVTVNGEPAEKVIRASDILGGNLAVSVNGSAPVPCIGDEEYILKRGYDDTTAKVVSTLVGGLQKFTFAWIGIGIVGGTLYFVVLEPYFGPFF